MTKTNSTLQAGRQGCNDTNKTLICTKPIPPVRPRPVLGGCVFGEIDSDELDAMLKYLGIAAVAATTAVDIRDSQFKWPLPECPQLLYIPFWTRNHWILLTRDGEQILSVFDSAPSKATCADVRFFVTQLQRFIGVSRVRFEDCPKQPRGSNQCGVHVIANAVLVSMGMCPPTVPVVNYDALRFLINIAIAEDFSTPALKTEFVKQVTKGSFPKAARKNLSGERVRATAECLKIGDRLALEWTWGDAVWSDFAVTTEAYNASCAMLNFESLGGEGPLPAQGVVYHVVDVILSLSASGGTDDDLWEAARTWNTDDEIEIRWVDGNAEVCWVGKVLRPATRRTPARLLCFCKVVGGTRVPLRDEDDGALLPLEIELPDKDVHYLEVKRIRTTSAPSVTPASIATDATVQPTGIQDMLPISSDVEFRSEQFLLRELPHGILQSISQFPTRNAILLRGTDVTHLPINLSQTPQLCLLGLAKATKKHHIAIIRLLGSMDVDLHHAPLDVALLEFFTRLRTRRKWLMNTMKTKVYSVQGALRLLPLYCGQGFLPITLAHSALWSQATTGIQKLSKVDIPRKAKPVTSEQMGQLTKLPQEYACFFLMAWIFAARVGDLLQVAPKDVYMCGDEKIQIRFCRGKTASSKPYTVTSHMPTDIAQRAMLRQFILSRHQQATTVFSLKASAIRIALQSIARFLTLHSIRRGALQFMASNGVRMPELLRLSGHKSEASLLAYLDDGLLSAETEADVARTRPLAATLSGAGEVNRTEEWKHKSYEFISSAFPPERDIGTLPLHVKEVPHIHVEKLRNIPVNAQLRQRLTTALTWLDDSTKYLRRHCVLLPRHAFSDNQADLMLGSKFSEFKGRVQGTVFGFGVVELKTSPEKVYERIRPVFNPRVNKDLDKSVLQPSTLPSKAVVREHSMIKKGEHVIQFDFVSYYDQFPLVPDVQALFCFLHKEKIVALNSLPMGLRTSCEVAQAATEVLCSGTEEGVKCDIYIDNVRFIGPRQALIRSVRRFIQFVKEVGATIDFTPPSNTELDDAIAQRFEKRGEFLGEFYDYEAGTRSLSKKSLKKLDMVKEPTTIRQLAAVIGLFLWTADTLDVKCFSFFELFRRWRKAASDITGTGTTWGSESLSLSPLEREQFSQLWSILRNNAPTSIFIPPPTHHHIIRIVTDASGWGWGALAWFEGQATPVQRQGQWPADGSLQFQSSVTAEPEAVYVACLDLVPQNWLGQVQIFTDHSPIVFAAERKLIKSFALNRLFLRLSTSWPRAHFTFTHIAGESNCADELSRGAPMR